MKPSSRSTPAKRALVFLVLGGLLTGTATAAPFATLKGERSPDSGPWPLPTPFECPEVDTIVVFAACDTVLTGDTTGAPDLVSGYGCVGWDESGGEQFFLLDVRDDAGYGGIRLSLALQDYTEDLDIFLLSACDGDSCLAGHNVQIGLTVPAGFYWLVVDGYEGASGSFGLRVQCRLPGVPPQVCEPGGAKEVDFTQGNLSYEDTDSVFEQPNLMVFDSCGDYFEQAGEVWYALTLPHRHLLTIDVQPLFIDAALWLFDGCGLDATCLGSIDDFLRGELESLSYVNSSGADQTVYLAVDALWPPDPQSADPELEGQFDLSIGGVLPIERTSFGRLKALYR